MTDYRFCPVCGQTARAHNELVDDWRDEVVFYHPHRDGIRKWCPMSGRVAALRALESLDFERGVA